MGIILELFVFSEHRGGLFADCAVEELFGLGLGLPPKRRRPLAGQYRRSLANYGSAESPSPNAYAGDQQQQQGPVQNSFAGQLGSSPQRNDLGSGTGYGYGSPQPQQYGWAIKH